MIQTGDHPKHISISRCLEPDALQEVAGILTGAFELDPVLKYCMPKEGVRAEVMPLLYEKTAQLALLSGGVELLDGRAGALWLETRMEAPTLLALRVGFLRVLWRMGLFALLRLMRHEHYCASRARKVGPRRYGYLWVLGVAPEYQGQGWGAAALERALDSLRRRGHEVCLLKTETEGNVAFYQKSGFSCVDTRVVPSSGIRFWLMQKELRPVSQ